MAAFNQANTIQAYNDLNNQPLTTLRQVILQVNALPQVADGTARNLYFAYHNKGIVIDQQQNTAWQLVGGQDNSWSIQRQMIVSVMRGSGLPVGALAGQRHAVTTRVDATTTNADFWVTEMQNGCTVLILDWGNLDYSMFHIQPSDDNQFNQVGRALMWPGRNAKAGYKNAWLRSEANTIVANTGGNQPERYIMVQSMFEAAGGWVTQLLGVNDIGFTFYRQRARGNALRAERLEWTTWRWYVPWWSTY
ncbi:MAG TPA: hypothetical protein VGR02_11285 [Thermoanaerobaculia bacterium]|jgi:hypothetical protein|nr:hypothetical protein [Thermoanaerobaculia bacterium]